MKAICSRDGGFKGIIPDCDMNKFAQAICEDMTLTEEEANKFISLLWQQTTADVAEVKHGEWKMRGFDSACSECGYLNRADTGTRVRCDYPYCPKCGARMCGKHIKISERKLKNR